jgi:hypothetical protein
VQQIDACSVATLMMDSQVITCPSEIPHRIIRLWADNMLVEHLICNHALTSLFPSQIFSVRLLFVLILEDMNMRKLRPAILICCLAMLPSISAAEPKTDKFMQNYQSATALSSVTKLYLKGMIDGMGWANIQLKRDNQKPIYCPPPKLPLTENQAYEIIKAKASQRPHYKTTYVGLTLLHALKDVFPCR